MPQDGKDADETSSKDLDLQLYIFYGLPFHCIHTSREQFLERIVSRQWGSPEAQS